MKIPGKQDVSISTGRLLYMITSLIVCIFIAIERAVDALQYKAYNYFAVQSC